MAGQNKNGRWSFSSIIASSPCLFVRRWLTLYGPVDTAHSKHRKVRENEDMSLNPKERERSHGT